MKEAKLPCLVYGPKLEMLGASRRVTSDGRPLGKIREEECEFWQSEGWH